MQHCFLLNLLTTCYPTIRNKDVLTLLHLATSKLRKKWQDYNTLEAMYWKNFIQACSNNIYFFIYSSRSPESQQSISIHKAGRGESDDASQKLVSWLSQGGLWGITKAAEKIFLQVEKRFRSSTCNGPVVKINIDKIRLESSSDLEVIAAYDILISNSSWGLTNMLLRMFYRAFWTYTLEFVPFPLPKTLFRILKSKWNNSKKAIRKEISRASKGSDQERQS